MLYFFVIAVVVVLMDQVSKYMVLQYVLKNHIYYRGYMTSGNGILDFTYATNTGAAFSLFPNQQKFFIVVTILALAGILIYLVKTKGLPFSLIFGLAMIFGGATGNLTDRLIRGQVIDFIDLHWKEVYHWPTFNIADSCIFIGVFILFITLFRMQDKPAEAKQVQDNGNIEPSVIVHEPKKL